MNRFKSRLCYHIQFNLRELLRLESTLPSNCRECSAEGGREGFALRRNMLYSNATNRSGRRRASTAPIHNIEQLRV